MPRPGRTEPRQRRARENLPQSGRGTAERAWPQPSPLAVRDWFGERRPRGRCLERVGEVLGLVRHLIAGELHDAYRVGWRAVVGDHDLAHPQVATAADPQHPEVAFSRVPAALRLDRRPAPEPLPGLRIVQDRVGSVDRVLGVGVPALGGLPVLLYSGTGSAVTIRCLVHLATLAGGDLNAAQPERATWMVPGPGILVSCGPAGACLAGKYSLRPPGWSGGSQVRALNRGERCPGKFSRTAPGMTPRPRRWPGPGRIPSRGTSTSWPPR